MIERENDFIKKYEYKDYVIYEKETSDSFEYYLQNEKYGIIRLMFGLTKEDREQNMLIVYNNLEEEINCYKLDYEDKE